MASPWLAVADENQHVGRLLRSRYPRNSICRSYYAAYAACSGWLERHSIPKGETRDGTPRDNYAHERLAALLRNLMMWNEERWPRDRVDDIEDALKRLRDARTAADYSPVAVLTPQDAEDAARDARIVLVALRAELE
ncbi:MAG: HEPN domain-containing protein [Armatimonadetes bacterium]|nr:HEPN domain-containing protein [Armatimonadota bacterium]